MKKIVFVVLLLLIPVDAFQKVSAGSLQLDSHEVNEQQELTIKQAIELANRSALKWNKNAQLLQAINIDIDKPGKLIGSNGKR